MGEHSCASMPFGVPLATDGASYLGSADRDLLLVGGFVALCLVTLLLFRTRLALGAWRVAGLAGRLCAPCWRGFHHPPRQMASTLMSGHTKLAPGMVVKQMLLMLGLWVSFFALVHPMPLALHIPATVDRSTAVAPGFGFSLLTFAHGGLFALIGRVALPRRQGSAPETS